MMARHSLQRLDSPARGMSTLIHILGIASFQASFWYGDHLPVVMYESFGGQFKFLTMIGLALAEITFILGLLADLSLSPSLFKAKNMVAVCSTPVELVISALFWGLCAVDRDLLVPPDMDAMPFLADFGFHAMPAILLSIDVLLLSPPWTIQVCGATTVSLVFTSLYWIWTEICFSRNGWYPYPIFALLNVWQRVLLFGTGGLLMTGSTMGLKWLYGQLNGIEVKRMAQDFKDEAVKAVKPLKK